MELDGRVAIVTGASGAIGGATARCLAEKGMRVVMTSHAHPDEAKAVAASMPAGHAQHLSCDLTRRDDAARVVAAATDSYGRLDLVVNVAGATSGAGPFAALTEDDWTSAFRDNLFSAVWMSQAAIPAMREAGGQIVNITSVRGLSHCGREAIMAYSAAKAALINVTRTLAKDVAPLICVNAVAPGFVWTKNYEAMTEDQTSGFIDATLLKRFLTVDEIAHTVAFLAGQTGITGEVIVVDGGFSLKLQ